MKTAPPYFELRLRELLGRRLEPKQNPRRVKVCARCGQPRWTPAHDDARDAHLFEPLAA